MAKEGTVAEVATMPLCDFCKSVDPESKVEASFDGRTKMGPWGFMCSTHYGLYGVGLGTGDGQRLVLAVKETVTRPGFDCPVHGERHPLIAHWECFEVGLAIVAENQDVYSNL